MKRKAVAPTPTLPRSAGEGEIGVAVQEQEWLKCSASPAYFVDEYVQIYDKVTGNWVRFRLWRAQYHILQALQAHNLNVILKARQLGMSWLVLAYHGLWRSLFRPMAKVGIFSKRDDEAVYMLGDERLKGMYQRLPEWLQARETVKSDAHQWALSNGSVVRAFPTSAGDSYAMTDIMLDEYDLVPDQNAIMRAVKATIDGGGSMTMLSRSDKSRPQSEFKRVYRGAVMGNNGWNAIFVPWYAHPERNEIWYEEQKREITSRTGSLDEVYEQYPATDEEALAPRSLDKRIATEWLNKCYQPLTRGESNMDGQDRQDGGGGQAPAIPGLVMFKGPEEGKGYGIGVDPAEGNPTSDDSAIEVVELNSGEQVASLAGKFEPSTTGAHADRLGLWYNQAGVLVERNNHGHAVLLWLRDNSGLQRIMGYDGAEGWLDNSRGKALLFDACADELRDGNAVIHDAQTYAQLASIEGSTLRAPEGEHDDKAVAFALAQLTRSVGQVTGQLFF